MDPVDQPGASKPQPGSDPMQPISDADVEKTLNNLESMTTTLVQEVGTPANQQGPASAVAPELSAAPASPEPTAPLLMETPPPAQVAPQDTTLAAAPEPEPAVAADAATAMPPAAESPEASAPQAEPQADPNASGAKAEVASSADADVEQEINQAIQQLQEGKPIDKVAGPEGAGAGPSDKSSLCRWLLRSLARIADIVFTPVALVVLVLDLPFRWVPAAIKQLLSYLAVGTALMAGALWYYIMVTKPN